MRKAITIVMLNIQVSIEGQRRGCYELEKDNPNQFLRLPKIPNRDRYLELVCDGEKL